MTDRDPMTTHRSKTIVQDDPCDSIDLSQAPMGQIFADLNRQPRRWTALVFVFAFIAALMVGWSVSVWV